MIPTQAAVNEESAYRPCARVQFKPGLGLLTSDFMALVLAFVLSTLTNEIVQTELFELRPGEFYTPFLKERAAVILLLSFALLACFAHKRHYISRQPYWREVKHILLGLLAVAMVDGWLQFAFKVQPSRLWQFQLWFYAAILILCGRSLVRWLLTLAGLWQLRTIVIGTPKGVDDLRRFARTEQHLGYVIDGVLSTAKSQENEHALLAQLRYMVAGGRMSHALIDCDGMSPQLLEQIVYALDLAGVTYCVMPPLRSMPLLGLEVQHFMGQDFILLHNRSSLLGRQCLQISKRCFDVIAASLALLVCLAPFVVLGLLVKRDGGPAFHASPRLGRKGSVFLALKFRTMRLGADRALEEILGNDPALEREWKSGFKLRNDPRITWIGKFLRKTSLDELPQLTNVIRGEMSLVGPRPLLLDETRSYGRWLELYATSRPGITGMWQVSGRNELAYERRIELNNWYIRNWSFWHDLVIILKTVKVVAGRRGAS
jgi:Undecaprenyl-phosphate galactose phosphotransferase WbaP